MPHRDRRSGRHLFACSGRSVALALVSCLALIVSAPTPAHAADTLKDFISERLQGLDLNPFDDDSPARQTPKGATDTARSRSAARSRSRAQVRLNGRSARQVLGKGGKRLAAPLPRPRPFRTRKRDVRQMGKDGMGGAETGQDVALPTATAKVHTDAAGRVVVDANALMSERDHEQAVYLQPREIGHWDAATVKRAREDCAVVLAALNVEATPLPSIGGPQGCGIAAPVLVKSLGLADLKPEARLNCRFTAALHEWVRDVVQPEARRRFGQPVVAMRQLCSYACRRRGGISRGPVRISEHSFGNAIDIGAFVLADGTTISVLRDWGTFSALFNRKAAFLKNVRDGACEYFSTVLSPQYNKAHANHLHLDLGRGGRYKICK